MPMVTLKLMAGAARSMVVASARTTLDGRRMSGRMCEPMKKKPRRPHDRSAGLFLVQFGISKRHAARETGKRHVTHTSDETSAQKLNRSVKGAMQVPSSSENESIRQRRVNEFAERVYNPLYAGPYTRYIQTPAKRPSQCSPRSNPRNDAPSPPPSVCQPAHARCVHTASTLKVERKLPTGSPQVPDVSRGARPVSTAHVAVRQSALAALGIECCGGGSSHIEPFSSQNGGQRAGARGAGAGGAAWLQRGSRTSHQPRAWPLVALARSWALPPSLQAQPHASQAPPHASQARPRRRPSPN
jgi:hypothetical protein